MPLDLCFVDEYTESAVWRISEVTMANLPSDIRTQIDAQRARPAGGIGGRALENTAAARARDSAMGIPAPAAPEAAAKEAEKAEPVKCPRCAVVMDDGDKFCAQCGVDVQREMHPEEKLGVTFAAEDVEDYLFKGFILKDIKFFGKHTLTVKTSQPKDLRAIDEFLMNGSSYGKDDKKRVSDFYLKQLNFLCLTAIAVVKLDGQPLPDALDKRVAMLDEKGSAFVDKAGELVVLLNRAWTQYLEDQNHLLGS